MLLNKQRRALHLAPVASKRMAGAVGRNSTIEDTGHRGVPNPEIRCSDRHLAAAEDISLGLSGSD